MFVKSLPNLQENGSFIRRGKEVNTTAQRYSTKLELRCFAVSNPAQGVSDLRFIRVCQILLRFSMVRLPDNGSGWK